MLGKQQEKQDIMLVVDKTSCKIKNKTTLFRYLIIKNLLIYWYNQFDGNIRNSKDEDLHLFCFKNYLFT
jgi:hypothetical protein